MTNQKGKTAEDRLWPLPAEQWDDAAYAAMGQVLDLPGDEVPRAGSGHRYDPLKFDVIGLLVRHPDLAGPFLSHNTFLLRRGELPSRLRELAILRVTHRRRSAYEWGQHVRIAEAANDISADEVIEVARGNAGFEGADLLVLLMTDELLEHGHADWATWQRLVAAIGERQAIELIFVVGTYVLLAMAFLTWRLPPAPDTASLLPIND